MNVNAGIDYVLALVSLLPLHHLTLCNYFHLDAAPEQQVSSAALICHLKRDECGGGSHAQLHRAHTLQQPGSLHRLSWFPAQPDHIHLFDFFTCNAAASC